jgi:biotin transport system substrate-specific component
MVEHTAHTAETAVPPQAATGGRRLARQAGIAIAASALVALCAHIAVPLGFTPVPITLQPFAVLLLGLVLGPATSFAALTLYLLEGVSGLPVFNPHGPGGIAQLFGPTGGYLLAEPFAAALAGTLYSAGRRHAVAAFAGAAAGDLVILSTGTVWLGMLAHTHFSMLLRLSVVPFLGGDAAQLVAAACCALIFQSFRKAPQR